MATTANTNTQSATLSGVQHQQNNMKSLTIEITTFKKLYTGVAFDFDIDSAIIDISMMVFNGVIDGARVQFYQGVEMILEYSYNLTEGADAWGPPANQPPQMQLPAGANVRLVVTRNRTQPKDYVEGWFKRLGWSDCPPLSIPENTPSEHYGTFASGGLGIERRIRKNPRFDQNTYVTKTQSEKEYGK